MTRPDDATLSDAVEEAVQRLSDHIPGGLLAPEDYQAVYIEVAAMLDVPIDDVRAADRARGAMAGGG